ncbi:MAG: hypothetical protein JWN40_4041 [Phycisphaerales bacterium]|nr:hypothetical protein [Phycisphaerales bacterium]
MSQRNKWTRLLQCTALIALAMTLALGATTGARAADEQDPNDPALKKAGKKMTQEQLIRIRIAELESGAIAESMKTPEAVVLSGPPLTDREKVVHVLNRLSFGWRPGEIDDVIKAGGWDKWVKQQMEPDKIDDSKLEALVDKRYAFRKKSMLDLSGEYPKNKEQAELRKEFKEMVLMRAVMSKRQFNEVMSEFWRNHFCVDIPDNDETSRAFTAPDYEEKVIRPYVFGNFKQMLYASATHPAMLEYLDNFKSKANNWNENYAREVMELHTLGADRFYNENDVVELSKVLTGWTFDKAYKFTFNESWQQPGSKNWLGMTIKPGYAGGEQALYTLATHRGTADFICFKLCRYLVNDNPQQSLVTKVASVFRSTDGDLPRVYAAIINSPEFMQRYNYRAKFKTPFEYTVSALRTTDATVTDGRATLDVLAKMGEPLYSSKDPTGYYDQAEAWRDAGVLTSRWDYSWKLLRNSIPGVTVSSDFVKSFAGLKDKALEERLVDTLIGSDVGNRTLELLRKTNDLPDKISVLMGSPSYQQQ